MVEVTGPSRVNKNRGNREGGTLCVLLMSFLLKVAMIDTLLRLIQMIKQSGSRSLVVCVFGGLWGLRGWNSEERTSRGQLHKEGIETGALRVGITSITTSNKPVRPGRGLLITRPVHILTWHHFSGMGYARSLRWEEPLPPLAQIQTAGCGQQFKLADSLGGEGLNTIRLGGTTRRDDGPHTEAGFTVSSRQASISVRLSVRYNS